MYVYFNPNYMRNDTTDCVIRVLCKITGQSRRDVYWDLCDIGAEPMAWDGRDISRLSWAIFITRR